MKKGDRTILRRWLSTFLLPLTFVCLLIGPGAAGCAHSPENTEPPSQVVAGLVVKLTLEQLSAEADDIVVGKVTGAASYEEGGGAICTLVTLAVEQTIKGEDKGELDIRIAGGEVGGRSLWVEDAPSFRAGERVVVFLAADDGILGVLGGFQGKFSVDDNNMVGGGKPLTEFIDQIKSALARI